ncbi:MAG: precorrin-2/cobalt-factor-2 C20-methyltransferase [Petroclostridium sp.]|nr:precorrin-2 C(20)-methyltransferase [Clostridia bacterium]MDK2810562.1 precorrin-2/cobalt-factor-2 C20-methyltransferase [Petroclostridium sp.]
MKGKFYGIGVGPGDAELVTLKAKRLLDECEIIVAPKTAMEKQSVALNIVKPLLADHKKIIELIFPMTYDESELSKHWDDAAKQICSMLDKNLNVVFLTLGDPMVYSTYIYIFRRIKDKGYEAETVPGITSFCAAASRIDVPLAEGKETVAIIPSAYECENLDKILVDFDNIVLMKVSRNYEQLVEVLERHRLKEKSVLVSRCGLDEEIIEYDLDKFIGQKVNYLSMIIVKKSMQN